MLTIDTAAMPWEPLANGLGIKRLRADGATGGSTAILRAPPRPRGVSRPHYHTGDETILNLGPPMRFEPGAPLQRLGYSHYPAGVIHGFDVDLPDGYEVLVRTSSAPDPFFPDELPHAPAPGPPGAISIASPDALPWLSAAELGGCPGASMRVLHRSGATLSALAALDAGARLTLGDDRGPCELLILEGDLLLAGGGPLGAGVFAAGGTGLGEAVSPAGALLYLHIT